VRLLVQAGNVMVMVSLEGPAGCGCAVAWSLQDPINSLYKRVLLCPP
jgi:hypothetical protein